MRYRFELAHGPSPRLCDNTSRLASFFFNPTPPSRNRPPQLHAAISDLLRGFAGTISRIPLRLRQSAAASRTCSPVELGYSSPDPHFVYHLSALRPRQSSGPSRTCGPGFMRARTPCSAAFYTILRLRSIFVPRPLVQRPINEPERTLASGLRTLNGLRVVLRKPRPYLHFPRFA